ncbi:MAG: hypothetical protein KGL11_02925 [Alphaproteobacteria bacterium]|nr:hypothetical protein [Alphaproteobacteria bacterium]
MARSFRDRHREETYKALALIAMAALKAVFILNGGAAIALLAFLGREAAQRLDMRLPMILFVTGVCLAAFAHVGAYLAQLALYNETLDEAGTTPMWRRHDKYLWATVVLAVLSIAVFGWGAISAALRFQN